MVRLPDGKAGAGEGVPVRDLGGQAQITPQGPHLVFVEILERLHHPAQFPQLPHQFRVVVVSLDTVRVTAWIRGGKGPSNENFIFCLFAYTSAYSQRYYI
jgi:hypothetical protein